MIDFRGCLRAATVAVFFTLLSACGGGGGGGGGDSSPAPTPADEPNAYFPTSSALSWDYTSNSGPNPVSLSFAADRISDGLHIHALQFPTGGKEYYVTSASQIKLKGLFLPQILVNGGSYTGDITFNSAEILWDMNLPDGQTRNVSGSGTVNVSPTYGKRSVTYSGNITAGMNGTANGQPLIRIAVNLTMSATIEGATFVIPYNMTFWLAENIGIVMRTQDYLTYTLVGISGPDRDGDGVTDALDKFPDDPAESSDFDNDGVGNNADTDDDNDGVADADDEAPTNSALPVDTDGDGVKDIIDPDDDNDGIVDTGDAFPVDASEWADSDSDGSGNNADTDDDNDGVIDASDYYPTDSARWAQSVIYASDDGVALSSISGASKLTHAIVVHDSNNINGIAWTASSDQSWLTITPSGVTGGILEISGDPSGLTPDVVHYATVTITPNDDQVLPHTSVVRVAIWASNNPSATDHIDLPWQTPSLVATDPIRPYVYVAKSELNSNADGFGGKIYVYNMYNKSLVRIISTSAANLGEIKISSDGSYLFATDATNYTQYSRILRISLDTLDPPVEITINDLGIRFAYSRPNGHGVLIMENGRIYDGLTLLPFDANFIGPLTQGATSISASTNGRKFCAAVMGGNSPYDAHCYSLDYSDALSVRISASAGGLISSTPPNISGALTSEGDRFYLSHGQFVTVFSPDNGFLLTLPLSTYSNPVVVDSSDSIYGVKSNNNGTSDFWSYDRDLVPRTSVNVTAPVFYFDVSGDALMINYTSVNSSTGISSLRFAPNY